MVDRLDSVCKSCGSKYHIDGTNIVIELLPLSEKQTTDLEAHLTNGIVKLCQEFRSKRGQDRFELGQQLFALLPHSPVTSSKDIGTGTIVTHDFQHPSYLLYKRDVLHLLGEPDRNSNIETFAYSLRPKKAGFAELCVEFGKYDFAINPGLYWQ